MTGAGRRLVLALIVVVAVTGCGRPSPQLTVLPMPAPTTDGAAPATTAAPTPTTPSPASSRARTGVAATRSAGRPWSVEVTFYGAQDNDPPGSTAISHPTVHHAAGGTGTYADPITLASDPREIAVGTRVYYPALALYFVMEDNCAGCVSDWEQSRTPHIDLWTGDASGSAFLACENALTPDGLVTVELNPPPGRRVDARPLWAEDGCRV